MDEAMEEVVEEEMNRCFEALKKHQAIDVNYIDFLEVDKDMQVAGEQSIEEIVKEVMGKEDEEPLLAPKERITGEVYQRQLMHLSRALQEKQLQYTNRHDKVILQHDNAWPHAAVPVKTYLETLKWDVLPHPSYSPDIAPFDYLF
ncbi:TMEM62 [Cordylochernes scorpioides]|uniref:TMEM62 n=1 Tax=Cordylochernes scorpioides TaxID=51811 RepID=A0ABY6LTA0_9ARAC|nr:TMEM62 [Cordylochernes scorpioides]